MEEWGIYLKSSIFYMYVNNISIYLYCISPPAFSNRLISPYAFQAALKPKQLAFKWTRTVPALRSLRTHIQQQYSWVFSKHAIAREHSRTCAAHEGLQSSLTEDSVDAVTSAQIISIDNIHFFNSEELPIPERIQAGFYMASSVFPQPTTARL